MGNDCFHGRIRDGLIVVILIAVVAGVSHFLVTNPLGFSRILYIVEAPLIARQTRCAETAPDWMHELQRYATRQQGAAASQLAFIEPGGRLHHCETGWKDGVWGDSQLEQDTRFRFASVTKPVTAAAILELINRNKLSPDDRLVEVMGLDAPLKDERVAEITVAHLLSHRGGWDRVTTQDAMFLRGVQPWCPGQYQELANTTLQYRPGTRYAYSNLGYCLLGVVIERVTGQPYRDYVSELFEFDESTLAFVDGPYHADEVTYDTRHENFYTDTYFKYFDFKAISAAAGLSGSASDLARLFHRQLRSEGAVALGDGYGEAECNLAEFQSCYGYGLYRYQPTPEAEPVDLHGGKFPGNTSVVMMDGTGAVLVWVGAGSKPGAGRTEAFYNHVYQALTNHARQ